nr:hypothetical protein [uncultured Sphaerochaeta sp.]
MKIKIESIELDQQVFENLGLSNVPGVSTERILACLRACKMFSTEALDLGLVEEAITKTSKLTRYSTDIDLENNFFKDVPLFREAEPSLDTRLVLR